MVCWYLFALDIEKNEYRTYKVSRIQKLELINIKFQNEEDVEKLILESERKYLKTCENIKVWCHRDYIDFLEEYFPEERKEKLQDDNYIMILHVPPNERLWQALLLSMGDAIKVIEPESYRDKLIETAFKFLSNYDIQMS